MNKKVIVFGIDSASLDLIQSMIEKGGLKNFKKIMEQGSYGLLRSSLIAISASAWTSFITGKNPGKHGVYDFFDVRDYSPHCKYFSDIEDKPFWDILSESGRKSYVINIPLTYPPKIKKGVLISGLQTPPGNKDFVYPESFRAELNEVSPDYKVFPLSSPKDDIKNYIKEIDIVLESQLKLVSHLLKKKDWDLLVYVVQNTDTLQHYLWHYIDESHSHYEKNDLLKDAVSALYEKIDDFLSSIMSSMDDDTFLFVISDHGAGKVERHFYINNWLLEKGYLSLKDNARQRLKRLMMKVNICDADLHNIFVAGNPLARLFRRSSRKRDRVFYKMKEVDWTKTIAYGMNLNQLFINLKGRELHGVVEPADYEETVATLIGELKKIRHPYKDKPLIDQIYQKDKIFSGEKIQEIPDIIFVCDDFEIISPGGYKVTSSRIFDKASWSGYHRLHGILMCYGKGFTKGIDIKDAKIEDIPSTVVGLLDGIIPLDFDGRMLQEVFKKTPLVKKENVATKKEEKQPLSDSKDEKVKKMLESLGYM